VKLISHHGVIMFTHFLVTYIHLHYNVFNQQCELFEYLPLPLEADVEVEGTGACGSGREPCVTLPMVMADRQGGGCATSMTSSMTSANPPSSTEVSILTMKASPSKETMKNAFMT